MAVITSIRDHKQDGEPDRASITANGIVVDVIASNDGTVYVEIYASKGGYQVFDEHGPAPSTTYSLKERE